jgi:hypothetical protein
MNLLGGRIAQGEQASLGRGSAIGEGPWTTRRFMQRLLAVTIAMSFLSLAAAAQTSLPSVAARADQLSLDQKVKISQLITKETEPLAATSFFIAVDAVIPPDIQVHPLPAEVEQLAPQLRGFGYVVIEEQIAIVDQATRKIDLTFPRWR